MVKLKENVMFMSDNASDFGIDECEKEAASTIAADSVKPENLDQGVNQSRRKSTHDALVSIHFDLI